MIVSMPPAAIANKKGNNGGKKKKPTGDESEFFLHHYPDGDGPDADLIRTLERDMVGAARLLSSIKILM